MMIELQASDLAGGARKDSVSSGSSEDSESDSDASQVSPDEDDALAAGRLDSNQSTEQFAAEVRSLSTPVQWQCAPN